MTNHVGSTKHFSRQVRDQEGTATIVRLVIAEQHETGTLSILTPAREVVQQFVLSHLKKAGTARTYPVMSVAPPRRYRWNVIKTRQNCTYRLAYFPRFLRLCILLTPQSKSAL